MLCAPLSQWPTGFHLCSEFNYNFTRSALLQAYAGKVRVRVGGLLLRDGAMLLAGPPGLLPRRRRSGRRPAGAGSLAKA